MASIQINTSNMPKPISVPINTQGLQPPKMAAINTSGMQAPKSAPLGTLSGSGSMANMLQPAGGGVPKMGVTAKFPTNNIVNPQTTLPYNQQQVRTTTGQTNANSDQVNLPNTGGGGASGSASQSDTQKAVDAALAQLKGIQETVNQQQTNSSPYQNFNPQSTYGQYVSALANVPTQNQAVQQAQQNLQNLQTQYAQQSANIEGQPIDLSLAGGQQGILNRLFTGKQQAAQTALSNALQQQGLQQQALGTAAGLAQPVAAQALGFYSPTTGQFTQYGGGQGGGAYQAGSVLGQVQMGEQAPQLYTTFNQSSALIDGLKNFIQQNPQINPSNASFVNNLTNWVAGQASDPSYALFNQQLTELLNTSAPLVGAMGGATNFKQMIVNSLVNGTQQGQTVQQSLDGLKNIMATKLGQYISTGQNPQPNFTGTGSNTFGSFFSPMQ